MWMCLFFHQGMLVIYPDFETAIDTFIGRLSGEQRVSLTEFLREKLDTKTEAELADLWEECGSDWYILDAKMREFCGSQL